MQEDKSLYGQIVDIIEDKKGEIRYVGELNPNNSYIEERFLGTLPISYSVGAMDIYLFFSESEKVMVFLESEVTSRDSRQVSDFVKVLDISDL